MKKILIVDDEKDIRELLKDVIILITSYQVDSCENGEEALVQFQKEEYDLVICDYNMPKMNGAVLLEKIRSLDHKQPFYIITGDDTKEYVEQPTRLILKPFDITRLVETIKEDLYDAN